MTIDMLVTLLTPDMIWTYLINGLVSPFTWAAGLLMFVLAFLSDHPASPLRHIRPRPPRQRGRTRPPVPDTASAADPVADPDADPVAEEPTEDLPLPPAAQRAHDPIACTPAPPPEANTQAARTLRRAALRPSEPPYDLGGPDRRPRSWMRPNQPRSN